MTAREKDVLEFCKNYFKSHGYSPTIKEICAGINTKSNMHVRIMLEHLKDENHIDFQKGMSRTIVIK